MSVSLFCKNMTDIKYHGASSFRACAAIMSDRAETRQAIDKRSNMYTRDLFREIFL